MQQIKSYRVEFIFFIIFLILTTFTLGTIYKFNTNRHIEYLNQITANYTKAYSNAYFEKKQLSKILKTGLLKMGKIPYRLSKIQHNYIDKNKIRLKIYNELLPRYKELKTMGIDQLHIHLSNNESFLRMHKPKFYGDDLTAIRPTVAYVNRYLQSTNSMEEGKIYFGLRFVYPLFYKKEHVGSIEISYSISSVTKSIMGQYNVESNFFISQKISDQKNFKNIQDTHYLLSVYNGYYCDKKVLAQLQTQSKTTIKLQKQIEKIGKGQIPDSIYDENSEDTITVIPIINKLTKKNIAFLTIRGKANYSFHNSYLSYFIGISFLLLSFSLIYLLYHKKEALEYAVEEKTKEQNNLLSLFDKGDIILFRWYNDIQWSIDFVSQNTEKLLGYTKDDFLSKRIVYSDIIILEDKEYLQKEVQNALDNNRTFLIHEPYRIKMKNGSIRWILDHTLLVRDKQNNVTHFLGYIVDITNIKEQENILQEKIEEALEKNIKQLEILQQQSKMASMGEMMGAIAHQWRQPLNVISTSIQNLKYDYMEGKLNDKDYIDKFIQKNKQTIKFMSHTIDDFRSFFRLDKEKVNFKIKESVESVLTMLLAQLKNYNISLEVKGEEFIYYGLPNEFQQVVLNIINNAKDALIEKRVENPFIKIKIISQMICIQDNAGGIDEQVIKRIFEPYFTTKEQGKGTGIGLYMSKIIIEENMNGILDVVNVDDGAIFIIDFSKDTDAIK